MKHVNDQGGILGGKLGLVLGDSKCDPQSSVGAANKLVNVENVAGIVGALCSGATIGAANAAAGSSRRRDDFAGLDPRRRSPR